MITPEEERYLDTIPASAKASVRPYDPQVGLTARKLIDTITTRDPSAEVLFMGAAALKIAGQNDIDLYVLSPSGNFNQHLPHLTKLFGAPVSTHLDSIKWSQTEDGFNVEIYLTDPQTESMQRQIKVFELLRDDSHLCAEYEQLKLAAAGLTLREYQRCKYEFYNRILSSQAQ